MSYCNLEDKGALLTYLDGDSTKREVKFENVCPIEVTVNNINKDKFHSSGDRPLNYFAPGDIIAVSCTGTFRQIGDNASTELPCTYILANSVITGNRLQSEHDSNYGDNTGDMEFFIEYKSTDNIIRVYSNGNLIFKDVQKSPISYKVECIKQRCPEGYCECKQDTYPGYCCNNCKDTANEIHGITEQVRSKNGK